MASAPPENPGFVGGSLAWRKAPRKSGRGLAFSFLTGSLCPLEEKSPFRTAEKTLTGSRSDPNLASRAQREGPPAFLRPKGQALPPPFLLPSSPITINGAAQRPAQPFFGLAESASPPPSPRPSRQRHVGLDSRSAALRRSADVPAQVSPGGYTRREVFLRMAPSGCSPGLGLMALWGYIFGDGTLRWFFGGVRLLLGVEAESRTQRVLPEGYGRKGLTGPGYLLLAFGEVPCGDRRTQMQEAFLGITEHTPQPAICSPPPRSDGDDIKIVVVVLF